jgi:hypothetical protein
VLNAAQAQQFIRKSLHVAPSAFENNHLQAVAMIEMDVGRHQDFAVVVMLGLDKALIQLQVTADKNRLVGATQLLPIWTALPRRSRPSTGSASAPRRWQRPSTDPQYQKS